MSGFDLSVAAPFLAFLINLILSLLILQTRRNKERVLFAMMLFFVSTWALGIFGYNLFGASDMLYKLIFISPIFISLLYYMFASSFTEPVNEKTKTSVKLLMLVSCLYALFLLLRSNAIFMTAGEDRISNFEDINLLGYLFYGLFISTVFTVSTLVLASKKKTNVVDKRQVAIINNLVFSIFTSASLAIIVNLVLSPILKINLLHIGTILIFIFVSFFFQAASRYKLFDMRLVLMRTLPYGFLLSLACLLYFSAGVFLIKTISSYYQQPTTVWVCLTVALLLGFGFSKLKQGFITSSDKLLYRQAYRSASSKQLLEGALSKTVQIEQVTKSCIDVLMSTVRPVNIDFMVFQKGTLDIKYQETQTKLPEELLTSIKKSKKSLIVIGGLDSDEIDFVMESHGLEAVLKLCDVNDTLIGLIALGKKKSGAIYNHIDREFLNSIAYVISLSIQKSLLFESVNELNRTLRAKVKLAVSDLEDKNKQLEELNEAQNEFISIASHQIRPQLMAAQGFIDLAEIDEKDKETFELYAMTQASLQRIKQTVAGMLSLSKFNSGHMNLQRQRLRLNTIVEEELKRLNPLAASKQITLDVDTVNLPEQSIDYQKISEVVCNLIDNAIWYSPSSSSVKVNLKLTSDNQAKFSVSDLGIGVPKNQRTEVFKRYFRAKNALDIRPDGSGIGLFVARKIIETHGGKVFFYPNTPKGSVFGFTLPLVD